MVKKEDIKDNFFLIALIAIIFVYFIPFFTKPTLLSIKDNDLGRTYIPILAFIKNSFWQNLNLPLWRPDQMGGESFISNPLFTLAYPANILFLILPTAVATVFYYFMHLCIAAISTFYLARSFLVSKYSSFAAAIFYTFSTKILLHISAGHLTMVAAFCYFPLIFLSTRKILTSQNFRWILTLAISLSFMLALYATVLYYTVIFLLTYWAYYLIKYNNLRKKFAFNFKITASLLAAFFLSLCLSAIFLLPQIEFGPLSTRAQLTITDVALPLWNFKRFFQSLFLPYLIFKDLDHESFLYLGFIPILLSFFAFFNLPKPKKFILVVFILLSLLFAAGLSTPVFKIAHDSIPFLNYSRITTRFWFIMAAIAALLSAFALDKIKNRSFTSLAVLIFLSEVFLISYIKIFSTPDLNFQNKQLYEFLANDKEIFRVYCTTYCFNPQLLSRYQIQTLNGESPIQSQSYVNFLQKAGNYIYNNFAVIFPPYEVWQTSSPPQPDSNLLGLANVKYIASTYELTNQDFIAVGKYENIYLYRNNKFQSRAYLEGTKESTTIAIYSPNNLTITYPKSDVAQNMILAELYYPGWIAYSNGVKMNIGKEDNIFREIRVPELSNKVEIKFEPTSYLIGKAITFSTILFLAIFFWFKFRQHKNG